MTVKITPWTARARPPLIWAVERVEPETPVTHLPSGPPQIAVRKTVVIQGRDRKGSDPGFTLPIAA